MNDLLNSIRKLANEKSELRKYLIPLIKKSYGFSSKEELQEYLEEHPKADKSKHYIEE